jgi:glycogen debranching enzyme
LLVPGLDRTLAERAVATALGPDFAGGAGLAFPVVLSTALRSAEFRPRAYWRGPAWPVVNWLLWWGLVQQGMAEPAAALRRANVALLSRPTARFAEYFEPFTGEPLGSPDQSWTAAVALDWLATQAVSD